MLVRSNLLALCQAASHYKRHPSQRLLLACNSMPVASSSIINLIQFATNFAFSPCRNGENAQSFHTSINFFFLSTTLYFSTFLLMLCNNFPLVCSNNKNNNTDHNKIVTRAVYKRKNEK